MCSTLLPRWRKSILVDTATEQRIPCTHWIPCGDVQVVTALIEGWDTTDGFWAHVVYQTAELDTDSPGSWTTLSSKSRIEGDTKGFSTTTDVSTATNANTWIRFGVGVKSDGATVVPERGEVGITIGYRC